MKLLNSLLWFLILCLTTPLVSQPTINETSQWKQYLQYGSNNCECTTIKDRLYQLNGDTLIGNINYFNVLVTEIYTIIYQSGSTIINDLHYYADPIREENNAIYAFNRIKNEEYLLYDFNLAIGDTIKTGSCLKNNVIRIDSVYLGLEPRKRFHLPGPDFSTLIEGIGSTWGFYYQACNDYLPPGPQKLQCYCQDGNCIQFDPTYDCNSLITKTEDIPFYNVAITPNPFQDEIKVQYETVPNELLSLSIVDPMGKMILGRMLNSSEPFEIIKVTDLPPGIYFIHIHNKKAGTIKKMVKL